MEVESISETLVSTSKVIRCHKQKDYNLKNLRRKTVKKLTKFLQFNDAVCSQQVAGVVT